MAGEFIWPPHTPRLPIFGSGPFLNVFKGDDTANSNASAHLAWGVTVPVLAERIGGVSLLWCVVAVYVAITLVHEACFHNADGPEVRTDLLTRIGSVLLAAGVLVLLHASGVVIGCAWAAAVGPPTSRLGDCVLCGAPKDAHCAPELFCDYNQVPGDKPGVYTPLREPRRPPPTPMPRPAYLSRYDIDAPQFRVDQHLWLWRVYLALAAAGVWMVTR